MDEENELINERLDVAEEEDISTGRSSYNLDRELNAPKEDVATLAEDEKNEEEENDFFGENFSTKVKN